MKKGRKGRRWAFVLVLLLFLVFHQLDVFLLRPITTQMITVLNARDIWVAPVVTISVGVSILFAFFWGYMYDRHSRVKTLAVVSFLWGVSSWLAGISPTLTTYLISSAIGGIDNLSTSGIFTLVGDFFRSKNRGKILGLLLIAQPMGLFLGIFISNALTNALNWRLLLLVLGAIAILFTFLINSLLHEPKRGCCERGMTDIHLTSTYLFDWESAKENLKVPSLLLIFMFSFFGTMPWYILTTWISPHLQEISQISSQGVAQRLLPALIAQMIGYPVGGFLGDIYAQKRGSGRVSIAILGLILPVIFLYLSFLINDLANPYFIMLFVLMGFFMSFSWPNVVALIFDITLPEVRSFTTSIGLALNAIGGLLGPYLILILQFRLGLRASVLWVTIGAWSLGILSLSGLFLTLPRDIENLRRHMAYRSHLETRLTRSKSRPET